jgi:hypothetical protein
MSACLEGKSTVASAKRQVKQDRAGECNKQANLRNLKGEVRKSFISSCLRG